MFAGLILMLLHKIFIEKKRITPSYYKYFLTCASAFHCVYVIGVPNKACMVPYDR